MGPVDINLSDLGWTDDIQDKIDILNDALMGLFILYVLGMGFSGIGMLACLVAGLVPERRSVALTNLVVASLATLALLIASILVTVAVTKGVDEINDAAEDIGVKVSRGNGFLAISWVAAGVMLCALVFWAVRFCSLKRKTKHMVRTKETY